MYRNVILVGGDSSMLFYIHQLISWQLEVLSRLVPFVAATMFIKDKHLTSETRFGAVFIYFYISWLILAWVSQITLSVWRFMLIFLFLIFLMLVRICSGISFLVHLSIPPSAHVQVVTSNSGNGMVFWPVE